MKTPSRPAARPLDWTAVRSRMAAAIEQTEALLEAAQQDSEAQYEQRSPRVAVDVSAGQSEEQAVGLVIFVLADRQFALEIRYVCEIVSRARVSPLPGMPPACLWRLRPARSTASRVRSARTARSPARGPYRRRLGDRVRAGTARIPDTFRSRPRNIDAPAGANPSSGARSRQTMALGDDENRGGHSRRPPPFG